MENYFSPLLGGLAIGAAASLLLLLLGRIAGISGILWTAVSNAVLRDRATPGASETRCFTPSADGNWRALFLAGLLLGALLYHLIADAPFPPAPELDWPWAVVGGFLVGLGTRLGSGCTSGHGVCGIGRLSMRSLVATLTFMSAGLVTVAVLRHLLGVGT